MSFTSQSRFAVRLEWGLDGIAHLAREVDCVVVVDVMSFSTCASIAVDRGALVLPYPWRDGAAQAYAERHGAVLASRDRGASLSLSPSSLTQVPSGLRLVLPSPNGSEALYRARELGAVVLCGSLRNRAATARACLEHERVLVVPCGERWPEGSLRPSLEDWLGAGAIASALAAHRALSPEARAAAVAWEALGAGALRECSSAIELEQRGFAADVDLCLAVDASTTACRLEGEALVAVRIGAESCTPCG